jgi:uncharacterized membrane protein
LTNLAGHLLLRELELEMDQRGRVLEALPMLVVEQRYAAVGPENLVNGVAVEKASVHDGDTRIRGARDHAIDIGHALEAFHGNPAGKRTTSVRHACRAG